MRLHFGSAGERRSLSAIGRKAALPMVTPVLQTRPRPCTSGFTPRQVMVLAHATAASTVFNRVPFQ